MPLSQSVPSSVGGSTHSETCTLYSMRTRGGGPVLPRGVPEHLTPLTWPGEIPREKQGCGVCSYVGVVVLLLGMVGMAVLLGTRVTRLGEEPCSGVVCRRGHQCEDHQGVAVCVCRDKCEENCPAGYWGVMSAVCQPCLCSVYGSIGQTCQHYTGQCECLPGHTGHKCDICPGGQVEKTGGCELGKTPGGAGMVSDMKVSGLLGYECQTHSDCVSQNAECVRGQCECRRGFLPSSPLLCKEDPSSLCSSSPCEGGGSCEEHDGTFTCYCTEGRLGRFCEKKIENTNSSVASFHGRSFVKLKSVPNSSLRVSIRFSFRTFRSSGVLFFSGEEHGGDHGDKLEIGVVGDHVHLSYSIGGVLVTLSSPQPVLLGAWHSVTVQRYRGDGMLSVDGRSAVTGSTGGSLARQYLGNYSYIGGVQGSDRRGLEGCVKDLRYGLQHVSLVSSAEPLLLSSVGVGECGDHPCHSSPCQHRGECSTRWGEERQWGCLCRRGYTGAECESRRGVCHPNPCQHRGVCYQERSGEGPGCTCRKGYRGRLCQEIL